MAGGTRPTDRHGSVRTAHDTARYFVRSAHVAAGERMESKVKSEQQILRFAQDDRDGSG